MSVIKSSDFFVRTVTDTTVTKTDKVLLVDATAAPRTITLPLASSVPGTKVEIKKIDSSANQANINVTGGDLINGSVQKILKYQFSSIILESLGGTAWGIVGSPLATTALSGTVYMNQTGFNKFVGTTPGEGGNWYSTIAAANPTSGDRILVVNGYTLSATETWAFNEVTMMFIPGQWLTFTTAITRLLYITGSTNRIYDMRIRGNISATITNGVEVSGTDNHLYGLAIEAANAGLTIINAVHLPGSRNVAIGNRYVISGAITNKSNSSLGTDSITNISGEIRAGSVLGAVYN